MPFVDGARGFSGASRPCSTIVVLAALLAALAVKRLDGPGQDDVLRRRTTPARSFPELRDAFWLNIRLFVVAEIFILAVALLVAIIRVVPSPAMAPLKLLAIVYTDVFRGTPTLLVIFLVGFGLPALGLQGVPTSLFWLGVIALTLSYGAYVAEVIRAGIASVHPSQWAAARSLGLSYGKTLRHVVLPQALRRVMPPLLNDFVSLQKDTALRRHRRPRRDPPRRPDQLEPGLQLHALRRRGRLLHRDDAAAGATGGLAGAASAATRAGGDLMAMLRLGRRSASTSEPTRSSPGSTSRWPRRTRSA